MSEWIEYDADKMRRALENVYMLASRKRAVVHKYEGRKVIPVGPRSKDTDWDHIIRFCESAGLRHSIVRAKDAEQSESMRFEGPCDHPNYTDGFSLGYALNHKRKRPHTLPKGWRWLKEGEKTNIGDVACDPRIAPVRIIYPGDVVTPTHHPIRRKS